MIPSSVSRDNSVMILTLWNPACCDLPAAAGCSWVRKTFWIFCHYSERRHRDLLVRRLQELNNFLCLMWRFYFARIRLNPWMWQDLAPRLRIGDCFEIHLPRWGLCDQSLSSHRTFLHEIDLRQCVFYKDPLSFWFSSRRRNFGDVPDLIPEKCVRMQIILCSPDFLWTPSIIQEDLSTHRPNISCHSFFFFILILTLHSNTEREDELEAGRTSFLDAISVSLRNESWDGDVEDETLSEMEDIPGTTSGTKLSVLQITIFPSFTQSWLLTADPLKRVSVVFAKLVQRLDSRRFLE